MRTTASLRVVRYLMLALVGATLSACTGVEPAPATDPRRADRIVYVVGHGWHTGLVLARTDIPPGLWPEQADFPTAEYLEVGWGDRDFYMAPENTVWLALKAALWPGASVLHVAGFRGSVLARFPASEVVELRLTGPELERLVRYVHDSHERGAGARTPPLGPGLYGDSRFYPSHERFHLFNTCNVWTARALAAAGLPVRSSLTLTASALLGQARELGRCLRCDGRSHAAQRAAPGAHASARALSGEYGARPAQAARSRPGTALR